MFNTEKELNQLGYFYTGYAIPFDILGDAPDEYLEGEEISPDAEELLLDGEQIMARIFVNEEETPILLIDDNILLSDPDTLDYLDSQWDHPPVYFALYQPLSDECDA